MKIHSTLKRTLQTLLIAGLIALVPACGGTSSDEATATLDDAQMENITSQEAKRTAEEAYIFAYSMLENYKTMYAQAVDENLPSFTAPFNQFNHWRQLLGPEFTEIVAPNNDTLYSMAWLDLGTEPDRAQPAGLSG